MGCWGRAAPKMHPKQEGPGADVVPLPPGAKTHGVGGWMEQRAATIEVLWSFFSTFFLFLMQSEAGDGPLITGGLHSLP